MNYPKKSGFVASFLVFFFFFFFNSKSIIKPGGTKLE